nr:MULTISPECIES: hypothetical protein [unclassified Pseudomonas]
MPFSMLLLIPLLCLASASTWSANQPCSGKKGGIARCDGDIFLCNDGSISASKKSCSAMLGGRSESARPQPLLQSNEGCQCGTGAFCTGPRGGVYCLTPSGNKSYKRK